MTTERARELARATLKAAGLDLWTPGMEDHLTAVILEVILQVRQECADRIVDATHGRRGPWYQVDIEDMASSLLNEDDE
jgi:uncharacterized phage-associated protein